MKRARKITILSHLVDVALPAGYSETPISDKEMTLDSTTFLCSKVVN
jgi:hypothetical protein